MRALLVAALVLVIWMLVGHASFACLKPDGDWVHGVSRKQCIADCRNNPFTGKRECGKWRGQRLIMPSNRP